MKISSTIPTLISAAIAVASFHLSTHHLTAQELITPTTVTLEAGTQFFPASNLINNSGLSAAADLSTYNTITHSAAGATTAWTTDAPGGGAADYFALDPATAPLPVFVFSLDDVYTITDLVFWGYHFNSPNGNESKSFLLEYSTDGGITYPNSLALTNPDGITQGTAKTLPCPAVFPANTIRLTVTDNWFGNAGGGDRAGLGEVKFIGQTVTDPFLAIPESITLDLDGTIQPLSITFTNAGINQNLTITNVALSGADAANFSISSFPSDTDPGDTGEIIILFNPMGSGGRFEAILEITSNDTDRPVIEVAILGILHDPIAIANSQPPIIPLTTTETSQTIGIDISNNGTSQNLSISNITFSGPDADHFSLVGGIGGPADPSPLSPATSGVLNINFDSLEQDGRFTTIITLDTNDPIEPSISIPINAYKIVANPLVAWWPLDSDALDASGNGHNGTITGTIAFGQTAATPATTASADFDGTSRIDVPFATDLNSPGSFTVTLWANSDTAVGPFNSAITSRDDVSNGVETHGFIVYNGNDGNWQFWTGDGNPGWDSLVGSAVQIGTWEHVAIVYDYPTNTKILYINCVEVARDEAALFPQYSPNGPQMENLHIGAGQDGGLGFFFDGRIDDVAVFREALTPAELQSICDGGVISFIGGADFTITSISRLDPSTVSFSFNSIAGTVYAVDRSTDLLDWSNELSDDLIGLENSTTFTDDSVPAGATRVFYRVRKL